jgi:hypothetical protein
MSEASAPLAAESGQEPQARPDDYAFTEIKTFDIPQEFVLENDGTREGEIWANTIRTYIKDLGTGLLWWGRLLEAPCIVKLVVGKS